MLPTPSPWACMRWAAISPAKAISVMADTVARQASLCTAQKAPMRLVAEQPTPVGPLVILVEKDFQCLQPRDPGLREDDSDAYPNPNPACGA